MRTDEDGAFMGVPQPEAELSEMRRYELPLLHVGSRSALPCLQLEQARGGPRCQKAFAVQPAALKGQSDEASDPVAGLRRHTPVLPKVLGPVAAELYGSPHEASPSVHIPEDSSRAGCGRVSTRR